MNIDNLIEYYKLNENLNLVAIIDLTNTNKYYDSK
jgi:hypothetical protein